MRKNIQNVQPHAQKWCEDGGMQLLFLQEDTEVIRRTEALGECTQQSPITIQGFYLPKTLNQQFASNSAIMLPLAGGPFDTHLAGYAMRVDKLGEVNFTKDEKDYRLVMYPIHDLIRRAAKMDVTAIGSVMHGEYGQAYGVGVDVRESLIKFVRNTPSNAMVSNAMAEIMLALHVWGKENRAGWRTLARAHHAISVAKLLNNGGSAEAATSPNHEILNSELSKLNGIMAKIYPEWRKTEGLKIIPSNWSFDTLIATCAVLSRENVEDSKTIQAYNSAITILYRELHEILIKAVQISPVSAPATEPSASMPPY